MFILDSCFFCLFVFSLPAYVLCSIFFLHNVTHSVTLLPQVHHKSLSLGEVLDGDRMAESLYHIRFRENVEKRTLCQLTLSEKQVFIYTRPGWLDLNTSYTSSIVG